VDSANEVSTKNLSRAGRNLVFEYTVYQIPFEGHSYPHANIFKDLYYYVLDALKSRHMYVLEITKGQ
jgi:hypothetical protein